MQLRGCSRRGAAPGWTWLVMENVTEWLDVEDDVTTSEKQHHRVVSWLLDSNNNTGGQQQVASAGVVAEAGYLPDWTDLILAVCFSTLIVITIVITF